VSAAGAMRIVFDGKSDGKNRQRIVGADFYRHCSIIHTVNE
jgi:hypothetical protein